MARDNEELSCTELIDCLTSIPTCRICLDKTDEDDEFSELINPCKCDGSMKWVHTSCITRERELTKNVNACSVCKHEYEYLPAYLQWCDKYKNMFVFGVKTVAWAVCHLAFLLIGLNVDFFTNFVETYIGMPRIIALIIKGNVAISSVFLLYIYPQVLCKWINSFARNSAEHYFMPELVSRETFDMKQVVQEARQKSKEKEEEKQEKE